MFKQGTKLGIVYIFTYFIVNSFAYQLLCYCILFIMILNAGDIVNTAWRREGLNKFPGDYMLIYFS